MRTVSFRPYITPDLRYRNSMYDRGQWYVTHAIAMRIRAFFNATKKPLFAGARAVRPLHSSLVPRITWIGHSSFLIQINGYNILTDPIFGDISFLFPRLSPPGIALSDLPAIHAILISHNHFDHMDSTTLLSLLPTLEKSGGVVLVPEGDQAWFNKRGFTRVFSSNWWQTHLVGPQVRCTFLPAYHWSQRGLFDRNKSLWGSWMIQDDQHTIYFGGDTAYANHFSMIAKAYPSIDIALLPVAPELPSAWMKPTHMDAHDAGQAFLDLGARHMVPMHWGTFDFGFEEYDVPIKRLTQWWNMNQNLISPACTLDTLQTGNLFEIGRMPMVEKQKEAQL